MYRVLVIGGVGLIGGATSVVACGTETESSDGVDASKDVYFPDEGVNDTRCFQFPCEGVDVGVPKEASAPDADAAVDAHEEDAPDADAG